MNGWKIALSLALLNLLQQFLAQFQDLVLVLQRAKVGREGNRLHLSILYLCVVLRVLAVSFPANFDFRRQRQKKRKEISRKMESPAGGDAGVQSLAFNSLKGHRDTVLCLDRSPNCLLLSGSEVLFTFKFRIFIHCQTNTSIFVGWDGTAVGRKNSQVSALFCCLRRRSGTLLLLRHAPYHAHRDAPQVASVAFGSRSSEMVFAAAGNKVHHDLLNSLPRLLLRGSHLRPHDQIFSFDLRKPDIIYKTFETEYAHNQDEVNSVGVTTVTSSPFFY